MGVFATRSSYRPNGLGLSVVALDRVVQDSMEGEKHVILHVRGADLVDRTPIVDIKPYLPYCDCVVDATACDFQKTPRSMPVFFRPEAEKTVDEQALLAHQPDDLKTLIAHLIGLDPRPAYRRNQDDNRSYGISAFHLNIRFQLAQEPIEHTGLPIFRDGGASDKRCFVITEIEPMRDSLCCITHPET